MKNYSPANFFFVWQAFCSLPVMIAYENIKKINQISILLCAIVKSAPMLEQSNLISAPKLHLMEEEIHKIAI